MTTELRDALGRFNGTGLSGTVGEKVQALSKEPTMSTDDYLRQGSAC